MATHILLSLLGQLDMPSVTPDDGSTPLSWAWSTVQWMITQFHNHNSAPAVGMGLMLMVYVFNKFVEGKLNPKLLPYCSATLGVVTAVGMQLMTLPARAKPHAWLEAILYGLTMGASAVGFWHMIGKVALPKLETLYAKLKAWLKLKLGKPTDPPAPPSTPPSPAPPAA